MKLSIIIPVYNNFKNLSRCLKNLSKQTVFDIYKDKIEVIVIDDGSQPPLSSQTCFGIPDLKAAIKKYQIEHLGAARARNVGFNKSSGEYIFCCDADVVFLKKHALEKMMQTLEANPDKAYCYSGFKYGWKKIPSFTFDAEKLKENNYISTMSLIRRGKFPGFDENLKRFQDWDLWLTILKQGEIGVYIPEILWQAQVGGSMSRWLPKSFYKIFRNSRKVQEFEAAKKIVKNKHKLR